MKTQEQVHDFLVDLRTLTLKHGIAIGGCGECGSPWIYEVEDDALGLMKYGFESRDNEYLSFKHRHPEGVVDLDRTN